MLIKCCVFSSYDNFMGWVLFTNNLGDTFKILIMGESGNFSPAEILVFPSIPGSKL